MLEIELMSDPQPIGVRWLNIFPLILALSMSVLSLTGCHTIASYDQAAYEHATSTKAEAVFLMDKATTPYSQNSDKIDTVVLDLNKAYEYDKGRSENQQTVDLWKTLLNPEGHSFAGFLQLWKRKGQLHPDYIEEKKTDVEDAFNQIILLEQGKPKTGST